MSQTQAKNLRKWQCPLCSTMRGDTDVLESALHRIRKTKRPSHADLQVTFLIPLLWAQATSRQVMLSLCHAFLNIKLRCTLRSALSIELCLMCLAAIS